MDCPNFDLYWISNRVWKLCLCRRKGFQDDLCVCVPGGSKDFYSIPKPTYWEDGVDYEQTPRECVQVMMRLRRVLRMNGWVGLVVTQSQVFYRSVIPVQRNHRFWIYFLAFGFKGEVAGVFLETIFILPPDFVGFSPSEGGKSEEWVGVSGSTNSKSYICFDFKRRFRKESI